MRSQVKLFLSALLLLTAVTSACGDTPRVDSLTVSRAWTRPTPETATVAAVYVSVASPIADELVSVSSPVASEAMVHATDGESSYSGGGHHGGGGSMTMHGSTLTVEPGKTTTLSPGGMHIMLEGLREPLKEGDVFDLELTFKNGGTVTTSVLVALNGL